MENIFWFPMKTQKGDCQFKHLITSSVWCFSKKTFMFMISHGFVQQLNWDISDLFHLKHWHFNFITRLFLFFIYCVWEIALRFITQLKTKSYFLGNIVAYVLKFGVCTKKLTISIFDQISNFISHKKVFYEVELEKI